LILRGAGCQEIRLIARSMEEFLLDSPFHRTFLSREAAKEF
jgi:hypothetical protein